MLSLELVVLLGTAILIAAGLARTLHIAPPILMLVSGVALGFIPLLHSVTLPPDLVLLLFLPALLFRESLTTSLREIRKNLRGIILTSTLLVVATAGIVAVVAHAFGIPWAPAWVLGAAVAPTDATAVGAFTRSLPRRNVTILRAESLINDGTALAIYGLAVAVTLGHDTVTPLRVSWLFILAYGGGGALGAIFAWLVLRIRGRMNDPRQETLITIITPFAAYLAAELIGASGVIAVVVCGLIMSQAQPREGRATTRRQSDAFWNISTFLLNAILFVAVGIQLHATVRGLDNQLFVRGVIVIAILAVVLIGVRIAFLFASAYGIRVLDRRPEQKLRRVSNRARIMSGLAGFRGAVSLAAALAIPRLMPSGHAFPNRDFIIFVTAGVIVVLLVFQGLVLPVVVRWANLPRDTAVEQERRLAETTAIERALEVLNDVAKRLGTTPEISSRLRTEYEQHLRVIRAHEDEADDDEALQIDDQYTELRLEMLAEKRRTVVSLRDSGDIDDLVLRQVQKQIDIEEVRLAHDDPGH